MFHGSIVALVTPFIHDQIDIEALRALVEFHIAAGTHGIVAAGTTGESGTLNHQEKCLVIKTVVEQARERVPVIAGTAVNATRDCIALTQEACALGADAALIMTPAYIKPTQEGLYRHYATIAQAVALPIIVYNVPSRTACDMQPETVARLAKISNIVGIKEATGQINRFHALKNLCQDMIDIFSGDDSTAAEWILEGAQGVISVSANVVPRLFAKMCEYGRDRNEAECLAIHEQLLSLHALLFVESNPIPVKWMLNQMGRIGNEMRMPLTWLSEDYHQPLQDVMKQLKLID